MILVHSEKSSFWVNLCSKFIRILIFENVGKGSLSILPKLLWCKKHRSGPPPSASSCLSGLGFRLSALLSLMTEDLLLTLLTEDLAASDYVLLGSHSFLALKLCGVVVGDAVTASTTGPDLYI